MRLFPLLFALVLVLGFSSTEIQAQENYATKKVPAFVEPKFPGGKTALDGWLRKNLKYPVNAKRIGIQGIVIAEFTVTATGELNYVKIIQSLGSGCDQEVLRLINMMPKWVPAKRKGTNISYKTQLRVTFGNSREINELEVKTNFIYNKGIEAQKGEMWREAIAFYDEVIEITPYIDLDAMYNRAYCYMKVGELESACYGWDRASKFGSEESKIMVKKYCLYRE